MNSISLPYLAEVSTRVRPYENIALYFINADICEASGLNGFSAYSKSRQF